MAEEHKFHFDTICLHGGTQPDATTGSRAVPIYQTTSYQFRNTEHAANLFGLREFGNIYTRIMNPTNDVVEQRIAALEGGVGALVTSSGQAAETLAILALAKTGDHIVSSASLYGGTYNLFHYTLPRVGIEVTFVDPTDPENFRKAIRPNTKAIYGETVGNPKLDLFPFEAVSKIAHENSLPLIIDNTTATPYLVRPFEWGADIVVHSTTKYIGGHGLSIGGVIVDSGKFDWSKSTRHAEFNEPDPSYHGLVYSAALGPLAYIIKVRVQLLRDIGASQAPFNSFLNIQGLETLPLRMERHIANANAVAAHLAQHPQVSWVIHPSLPNYPQKEEVKRIAPKGLTALIGFGIKGGREAGRVFIDNLKLFSHVANIGDAKSLAIHPATTTHSQLTPDEQVSTGVTDDFVRLSIGLEDVRDIIWDLDQALAAAAASVKA
ncbi:MAG: O-acetylhomoserine aminocarboxypropyltransferase/cysteine synthase family protein [Anaerolineae bacterium]|nr:O-acetylhomoserine aminocarboxypropyltransferase/cysteine synthase [Thermoflexales bacterium]MDW8406959.1 O-acetylhomoserine aminocarboxypropyltransferase/cysteine synthase family protein [Anaerolineae bacterium]